MDRPFKIDPDETDTESFRDEVGNFWVASEQYHTEAMEQRRPTIDKEMELQLAKELLSSNLSRLTKRQRDVMYYTMLHYSQGAIAKKLKITKDVVNEHLEAARKKLAKIITGTKDILKEGLDHGTEDINSANS